MVIDSSVLQKLKNEIPYKWRVQSFSKDGSKASCVAYIDARIVMNVLDDVLGCENWQSEFYCVDGVMFCRLGVRVDGEWIYKSDAGSEGNIEKEKSHASDCLKRAAVSWGIGRFLYNLPVQWIKAKDKKPVDDKGNVIWDLTAHINKNLGKGNQPERKEVTKVINISDKQATPEMTDEEKQKKEMQRDFNNVKTKSVYDWSNMVAKWCKKFPKYVDDTKFEAWASKYKPNVKISGEEIAAEADKAVV